MKKTIVLASLLSLTACGYASPDAGQEAVLVRKPWFFGDGGVDPVPVKTGSEVVASSTDAIYIDVTPRAFEVKFDDLMPSNGIPLDFVTVVRIQVTDAPRLVSDWGGAVLNEEGKPNDSWFWRNIEPHYQNLVRDAVKKYDMNQLALTGAAIDSVNIEVEKGLATYIKRNKMPLKLLGVTIGRANPPDEIKHQRIETAAQQQREQTMAAAQRAEQSRKAAEQARAEADNAYRNQMGLTPEQFVDLERIKMQRETCKRNTCIFGNASPVISR